MERITLIRRQMAMELGLVIPPVRIRDNLQLAPGAYSIKIKGVEVGRGELLLNHYLCMDSGAVTEPVEGIETREPPLDSRPFGYQQPSGRRQRLPVILL